jgi:hypothetical protein
MSGIARLLKKGKILSSENPDDGFPELPKLSTNDDSIKSELPTLLPTSEIIEDSPKSEPPVVVAEQNRPEPKSPTISTKKDNCSMCPFQKLCQDKLQCSAFLTGFGEKILQETEENTED